MYTHVLRANKILLKINKFVPQKYVPMGLLFFLNYHKLYGLHNLITFNLSRENLVLSRLSGKLTITLSIKQNPLSKLKSVYQAFKYHFFLFFPMTETTLSTDF